METKKKLLKQFDTVNYLAIETTVEDLLTKANPLNPDPALLEDGEEPLVSVLQGSRAQMYVFYKSKGRCFHVEKTPYDEYEVTEINPENIPDRALHDVYDALVPSIFVDLGNIRRFETELISKTILNASGELKENFGIFDALWAEMFAAATDGDIVKVLALNSVFYRDTLIQEDDEIIKLEGFSYFSQGRFMRNITQMDSLPQRAKKRWSAHIHSYVLSRIIAFAISARSKQTISEGERKKLTMLDNYYSDIQEIALQTLNDWKYGPERWEKLNAWFQKITGQSDTNIVPERK